MENRLEALLTTGQAADLIKRKLGKRCPPEDNLGRYVRRFAEKLDLGLRVGPARKGKRDKRPRMLRPAEVEILSSTIAALERRQKTA